MSRNEMPVILTGGDSVERKEYLHLTYNQPQFVVEFLERKNASYGVEEIRLLQKRLAIRGVTGSTRVFVIEEAEKLTEQAQQSLLLTLEDLPPGSMIVLGCGQVQALLPTVISRCMVVNLANQQLAVVDERLIHLDGLSPAIVLAKEFGQREETQALILQITQLCRLKMQNNLQVLRAIRYLMQVNKDLVSTNISPRLAAEVCLITWVRVKKLVELPKLTEQ